VRLLFSLQRFWCLKRWKVFIFNIMRKPVILLCILYCCSASFAAAYTRQDSLRGSNGTGRSWWDVLRYDLSIRFDTSRKSITGTNTIRLKVLQSPHDSLQLDLQDGMFLDKVLYEGRALDFVKDGNVFWVRDSFDKWTTGSEQALTIHYHGRPRIAHNPPWQGGFIWARDSTGQPWISMACQGLGASSWWPCKDYQADEPDNGMSVSIAVQQPGTNADKTELFRPDQVVGNGRATIIPGDPAAIRWEVRNPINTYSATFYIGDYVHWSDTLTGKKGQLDLDFYCLRYNESKAREQFKVTKQMLHCYEYWMGPYPFYEDGYKLVEAPFLGMEHQSAVAYGNSYKMGYRGFDRSGTTIGNLFDYIIIHESGHEWFGNNITAQDVADNWIHEGFTVYTEVLFTECLLNRDSAFKYMRGKWSSIRNDKPVIGDYGVHDEGSSDKYDKGAAVVHMIRVMMNNEERFRELLRGLNKDFYHSTVTSATVEAYISRFTGLRLQPLFDQYLRTTEIPVLEYNLEGNKLRYRFKNTVPGFTLPITVRAADKQATIRPTADWQTLKWKGDKELSFSEDFLYREYYTME
jgi:aminopeptidase N